MDRTATRWGCTAAALAAVAVWADPASANLIAAWNFNSYDGDAHTIGANWGSGALTIDAAWASVDLGSDLGTANNLYLGDAAGFSLQLRDVANNGLGIEFAISTSGLQDLILSLATERNGQGFNANQVSYSADGGSIFTAFPPPYNPPGFESPAMTFDFSSVTALNDNAQVVIRIEFFGAGNANGMNLIDNVQFNAGVIPAPATLALLGVAGVLGLRRRRRS